MVAQDRIGGGFQAAEFMGIIPVEERLGLDVHDVSGEENEVWMLGVDHIHPAGQFGLAVAVADVQVAGQDHFDMLLLQGLLRLDGEFLAILVMIMDAAGYHHRRYDTDDGQQSGKAVIDVCLGKYLAEHGDIGQYESDA